MEISLGFRKCNSATRMLGILLANKISNRLADQSGLWNFIYAGYTVGNGQFQALPELASMDTGTDYLYLNDMLVSAYYGQVLGATLDPTLNLWTFPCSAALPSLSLRFGSWDAVVPGYYLNASAISADCKWSTVSLSNDRLANLFN
jgi:Eukaryotic aspartyl protease